MTQFLRINAPSARAALASLVVAVLIAGCGDSKPSTTGTTTGSPIPESSQTEISLGAGVEPNRGLGQGSYVGKASRTLRVYGSLDPAGDGASISLERRGNSRWHSAGTIKPDSQGNFAVSLTAYRKNSNLYRLTAHGAHDAKPAAPIKVYFDRP